MKLRKPICVAILVCLSVTQAHAHIFPTMYQGYEKYHLDAKQYYIRVLPSPHLDGYYSYSLCPIFYNNMDLFVNNQRILGDRYAHQMQHEECIYPYASSKPVYFRVYDLKSTLNSDDVKYYAHEVGYHAGMILGTMAVTAVFPAVAVATVGARGVVTARQAMTANKLGKAIQTYRKGLHKASEKLVQKVGEGTWQWKRHTVGLGTFNMDPVAMTGFGVGYAVLDGTIGEVVKPQDQHHYFQLGDQQSPFLQPTIIDADVMRNLTQIGYFTGKSHKDGADMFWPVLPSTIKTKGELVAECRLEQQKLLKEKEQSRKEHLESMNFTQRIQANVLEQSLMQPDTFEHMNPLSNLDPCQNVVDRTHKDRFPNDDVDYITPPDLRTTIHGFWNTVLLANLYKAGHNGHLNPNNGKAFFDFVHDHELNQKRFERQITDFYNANDKHFELSLWRPVSDEFPDHLTTSAQTKEEYVCDDLRVPAYRKHLENHELTREELPMATWLQSDCIEAFAYDERHCREQFDGAWIFDSFSLKDGADICNPSL